MPWAAFQATMDQYWAAGGTPVDQPYRRPSPEGMVRCYLAGPTVAGFGHQLVGVLSAGPGEQSPYPDSAMVAMVAATLARLSPVRRA